MNDTEKQKIREEFYEFANPRVKGAEGISQFYPKKYNKEISDYWLSILDKTIKSKLEAVKGAIENHPNPYRTAESINDFQIYVKAKNDCIEIINKHK